MYKWAVTIYLKSGVVIKGVLECEYANSTELAEKILMRSSKDADFFGMYTEDKKGNLLFDTHEVAAIELRPAKG